MGDDLKLFAGSVAPCVMMLFLLGCAGDLTELDLRYEPEADLWRRIGFAVANSWPGALAIGLVAFIARLVPLSWYSTAERLFDRCAAAGGFLGGIVALTAGIIGCVAAIWTVFMGLRKLLSALRGRPEPCRIPSDELIRCLVDEAAEIRKPFLGGRHVRWKDGEMEIRRKEITNLVAKNNQFYKALLSLGHFLWGEVCVDGKSQHIMAAMTVGKEIGLPVTPLGRVLRVPSVLVGALIFAICSGCAYQFFSGWVSMASGLFVTSVAMAFIDPALEADAKARAKREGQKYWDLFPNSNTPREAARDQAKRRGLL